MHEEPGWELLDAYLAGTASTEQRAIVRRWLADVPGRQEALETLREDATRASAGQDVDAAWARVAALIGRGEPADAASPPARPMTATPGGRGARTATYRRAWRIAAMLLVGVGAGIVGREVVGSRSGDPGMVSATQEVATGPGERRVVTLEDGSRVTLNAGSRLRYDTSSTGARTVSLDGEAYFDVRHDERRPFRVHAHGGIAEDVGTRFVVRAYPEQSVVSVAVAEGAVRVLHAGDSADARLVTAGMLGTIPANGSVSVSALPTTDRYFAWMRGVLSLDGQPFREIVPMLEHWYGVGIRVPDRALGDKQVFGTFEHESLQDALAALALALDAQYTQVGQSVTFTPRVR